MYRSKGDCNLQILYDGIQVVVRIYIKPDKTSRLNDKTECNENSGLGQWNLQICW